MMGPVAPEMSSGWQLSKDKRTPLIAVARRVSPTPIWRSVLSANEKKKYKFRVEHITSQMALLPNFNFFCNVHKLYILCK